MYQDKMIKLLGEPKNYELLQGDPTNRIEDESNEFVKNMHRKGWIDSKCKESMIRHNSLAPKAYGLLKTHK